MKGKNKASLKGKFPNSLGDAIKLNGIRPADLARLAKTSAQNVHRFLNRERELTRSWAELFAAPLAVAPADLIFGKSPGAVQHIPLYSTIAAGRWLEATAVAEGSAPDRWVAETLPDGDWLAFEVMGDSMNVVAPDGSIVFVDRKDRQLTSGRLYAICLENGDATFKRYRAGPPRLEPMSTNLAHETLFFQEPGDVNVIGRVRKVVNDIP